MTLELCIVGAGECFEKYYLVTNTELSAEGVAQITTVVDIKDKADVKLPEGAAYLQRKFTSEPLSALLSGTTLDAVVLSHPNNFHVADAEDLVNRGYKVLMEKPYFVNEDEASRLELLMRTGRVALTEYYLFGKTAPLHILSGMVKADSFYTTRQGLLTGDVDKLKKNAGMLHELI